MSIDINAETIVSLAQARKHFPHGTVSPASIARWVHHGVRGHKLETVRIGSRRLTSVEAITRFIADQNAPESAEPGITAAQRMVQSRSARAALQEAGV